MATTATLRKMIAEILETADLNSISAKKVRQELEAKLDEDLSEKKKEIDNMVLEILNEKQNGADDDKGSKRKTKDESESEEEVPKKKKAKESSDDDGSEEESKKKKKPAGKRGGTGYTKLCKLSPELAKVMGEENMARHEVVKKMWGIVKEKQLYDPKNKQFAICNDDLLAVFGVKRFRTFGMMKYLKHHFLD